MEASEQILWYTIKGVEFEFKAWRLRNKPSLKQLRFGKTMAGMGEISTINTRKLNSKQLADTASLFTST